MNSAIAPVPVDGDYVVSLAQELIRIPAENPPGDCSGMAERILAELKAIGVDNITTYEYEAGMPNFIIQTGEGGPGGHFVIGGHMDTVPVHPEEVDAWEVPPFSGELKNGEIWGRGAADMKGALASTLGALKALRDEKIALNGTLTWVLLSGRREGRFLRRAVAGQQRRFSGNSAATWCSTPNRRATTSSAPSRGGVFFEVKVRADARCT